MFVHFYGYLTDKVGPECVNTGLDMCLFYTITHANHMTDHQWADLSWPDYHKDKRKHEHKVVRLVLEFDCLHFA